MLDKNQIDILKRIHALQVKKSRKISDNPNWKDIIYKISKNYPEKDFKKLKEDVRLIRIGRGGKNVNEELKSARDIINAIDILNIHNDIADLKYELDLIKII